MGGPFLFCGKRKNPPGPRQRDELAPLHSITSSAPMLSDRGHSHRWGMRMLLDGGVHMVPRLRANGEDIHRRSIDRWVNQTSCL